MGTEPKDYEAQQRPNVVVCLMDDLGFSDLGCYGSEIRTPTMDALAEEGAKFTQMYNSARCCPSRAALLTGLHPHQAGVGHMVWAGPTAPYAGYLNDRCVTIPEALSTVGYQTFMSGKWHVGGNYDAQPPAAWRPGAPGFPVPLQRGFDRFFGTLTGSGSYYHPATLMREDQFIAQEDPDWYYTDAIADDAITRMKRRDSTRPFFQYVAFTAPHWPLHARAATIESYRDQYQRGWDAVRTERYDRMREKGLIDHSWPLSPRDPEAWPWEQAVSHEWEAYKMATYAAQVEHLDAAFGRYIDAVRSEGILDNTLIFVLADNGGCAELLREDVIPDNTWPSSVPLSTPDGKPVLVGNRVDVMPGGPETFASYDVCWANVSNAPFRRFKRWVHEGGISTPLIVRWPKGFRATGSVVHDYAHITDLMPTILDATSARYPGDAGAEVPPLAGVSLLPRLRGEPTPPRDLFFEHEGNRAIRSGDWKLVSERSGDWELYNMESDRTESVNLADREPARLLELSERWFSWAAEVGADISVFNDINMIDSSYVGIAPSLREKYWRRDSGSDQSEAVICQ